MDGRDEPLTHPETVSHARDTPRRLKTSTLSERRVAAKPRTDLGFQRCVCAQECVAF